MLLQERAPGEVVSVVEITEAWECGVRTHLLQLARGLHGRGFAITLIASAGRGDRFRDDAARLKAQGIRVIELPMKRRIAPLADLAAFLRLRGIMKELRPDVVHTHASKAGALGRPAAWSCGVKAIIHTPHTFYFEGCKGISRWLFRAFERLLLRFPSRLVVLNEGQQALAENELGADEDRLARAWNGVDTEQFAPRRRRVAARRALGLPADAPIVGTITRFRRQKGCELFLRAAARVAAELPQTRFVIVGHGPLEDALRRLAGRLALSERIIWRKSVADPRDIYDVLDLFALSSRYEGMPYTLIEAMAMGLTVVAPRIPGCEEVLTEATGVLVPKENAEALADALIAFLKDPARARAAGQAARTRVIDRFNLRAALEQAAELYREAAAL